VGRSLCRTMGLLALSCVLLPGCLLVRTSEHIITFRGTGGDGIIHLIDIRSDAQSDSLIRSDFSALMDAYRAPVVKEFEQGGRTILSRHLRARGDTLEAEIEYTFTSPEGAVNGLRVTDDEFTLTFSPDRQIVRTNGSTERTASGGTRITWDREVRRLTYEVREKSLPSSVSLAPLYRAFVR
jgi:hypothetical protein